MTSTITSDPVSELQDKSLPSNRGIPFALVLLILVLIIGSVFLLINHDKIEKVFLPKWFFDFSSMQVSDGFHKISIPSGNHWDVAYEDDHEVIFQGIVLHNSPIRENGFDILTQDILVTTGDFSKPELVFTKVSNHHFIYRLLTDEKVNGSINLLHTLPINEEINQLLQQIKSGDEVVIKGWEILNLKSWNSRDDFIATWEDAGCNTTLVTQVIRNPDK